MMDRVTLCSATLGEDGKTEPPLGPLYIASEFERAGVEVDFRDYQLEADATRLTLVGSLPSLMITHGGRGLVLCRHASGGNRIHATPLPSQTGNEGDSRRSGTECRR